MSFVGAMRGAASCSRGATVWCASRFVCMRYSLFDPCLTRAFILQEPLILAKRWSAFTLGEDGHRELRQAATWALTE
jgi:hypothetical protein